MTPATDQLLTPSEAASIARCGVGLIKQWCSAGELAFVHKGAGGRRVHRLIYRSTLEAFLGKREQQSLAERQQAAEAFALPCRPLAVMPAESAYANAKRTVGQRRRALAAR